MLAFISVAAVVILPVAIISRRLSQLLGLIVVPVLASLMAGFGLQTGTFMVNGIQALELVAAIFIFAILFFGVVTDARMLDPMIKRLLKVVGCNPPRIAVGSALLALLVRLD